MTIVWRGGVREGALPSSMSTMSAGLPSMTTDPSLGTLVPAISPSSADLPAPVGPTTAANAPEGIIRLRFSSGPNVTLRNSMEGGRFTADNYSHRRHGFQEYVRAVRWFR